MWSLYGLQINYIYIANGNCLRTPAVVVTWKRCLLFLGGPVLPSAGVYRDACERVFVLPSSEGSNSGSETCERPPW